MRDEICSKVVKDGVKSVLWVMGKVIEYGWRRGGGMYIYDGKKLDQRVVLVR